jgi:hypothetical protein
VLVSQCAVIINCDYNKELDSSNSSTRCRGNHNNRRIIAAVGQPWREDLGYISHGNEIRSEFKVIGKSDIPSEAAGSVMS